MTILPIYVVLVLVLVLILLIYRKVTELFKDLKWDLGKLERRINSNDNRQYQIIKDIRTVQEQNNHLVDKINLIQKLSVAAAFDSTIVEDYEAWLYSQNHTLDTLKNMIDYYSDDSFEKYYDNVRIKDFRTAEQYAKDLEFMKDSYTTLTLTKEKWCL